MGGNREISLRFPRTTPHALQSEVHSPPPTPFLGDQSREVASTSFGRETPDRGFCVIRDRRRYRYCRLTLPTLAAIAVCLAALVNWRRHYHVRATVTISDFGTPSGRSGT